MEDHLLNIYQQDSALNYYKDAFDPEDVQETAAEVWENCVVESVISVYSSLHWPVILNVAFGLVTSFGLQENVFHTLSAFCGFYVLLATIQSVTGIIVVFSTFAVAYVIIHCYGHLQISRKLATTYHVPVTQYILIVMFVLFQYIVLDKETWLEIRGVQMVFSMKLISTVIDLPLSEFPSFLQYLGYMFCGANVLFGPWISFKHYMLLVQYPTRKNLQWVFEVSKCLVMSVVFLTISNCWASYLIPENSFSLLEGYKEALSFRTSHYFISYLSEAMMIAAGWKDQNFHFDDEYWKFSVTDFKKIEFPTSLSFVVVNWNKPMHEFLKKYIYKKWLPSGKFQAVLLTFVMSSLFHGFEMKVSTVLITLGVFSYLQIMVRDYISHAFDICVKVRPCKSCQHNVKRNSLICRVSLLLFSLLTVLHLIFLGVLMDPTTDEVGIYNKWNNLYFYSLWIMFVNFLIVK